MSPGRDRASVAAEVTSSGGNRNSRDATQVYDTWCEANGLAMFDADVDGEQQLLRFLHSNFQTNDWAWGTCNNYALGVAQSFQRAGLPDPRGLRVKQWLNARRRVQSGKPATPRTEALSHAQITEAATGRQSDRVAASEAGRRIARLRGLIAVGEAMGVDPTRGPVLQRLPASAFLIRTEDVVITDATGERHLLDRVTQPEFYDALREALRVAEDRDHPLRDVDATTDKLGRRIDSAALRLAWQRAAPRGAMKVTSAAKWRAAFDAGARADRVWWLKCVDLHFEARVQDRAYLLVGIVTAHRHATMRRLSIGHVTSTAGGYSWVVAAHEHKGGLMSAERGGRVRRVTKMVDHLADDPDQCPVHCPACALRDHLELRAHRGAQSADPLWIASNGAALTRAGASRRLHSLIAPLDIAGRQQVIGTRSLRVSAATLARQAGMSYLEIAEEITDHVKVTTAEVYVRRVDPFSTELVLKLTRGAASGLTQRCATPCWPVTMG